MSVAVRSLMSNVRSSVAEVRPSGPKIEFVTARRSVLLHGNLSWSWWLAFSNKCRMQVSRSLSWNVSSIALVKAFSSSVPKIGLPWQSMVWSRMWQKNLRKVKKSELPCRNIGPKKRGLVPLGALGDRLLFVYCCSQMQRTLVECLDRFCVFLGFWHYLLENTCFLLNHWVHDSTKACITWEIYHECSRIFHLVFQVRVVCYTFRVIVTIIIYIAWLHIYTIWHNIDIVWTLTFSVSTLFDCTFTLFDKTLFDTLHCLNVRVFWTLMTNQ